MYKELKRTWSNGDANRVSNFLEVFPELSKIDSEELCERFKELKMEFYYEEKTPVNFWIRLTLPIAILIMALMLFALPIVFLITGSWRYSLGKKNVLLNWFKSLRLL